MPHLHGQNISHAIESVRVSNAVSAGQTAFDSAAVIMGLAAGQNSVYFTCRFEICLGVVAAGGSGSFRVEAATDGTAWEALSGASVAFEDTHSNQIFWLEVTRPREGDLHLRIHGERASANSAVDSIVAHLGGGDVPVTQGPTVAGGVLQISPGREQP